MLAGLDGSLRGVRIGVPREYFFDAAELVDEVKAAVLSAVDVLAAAGATVVDVAIPHAAIARNAQRAIMFGEAFAYHESDLRTRPELYGAFTRQQLRQGALYSAADYVQAQRVRSLIKHEVAEVLSDVDVLITPSMLGLPPTFAGYDPSALMTLPNFMGIWNLTGHPALSVGCGFSSGEPTLPMGMQIIGKPFDEPMVLKVGEAYQRLTHWHTRTPFVAMTVAA
jgi:aspartyl-tRNA(Asn)/glutamyl-tRNA(Gln) amidotransferase subunit A